MLDFKYLAGFVDADGSLQIHAKKFDTFFSIYPVVSLSQLAWRDYNLREIAAFYELAVHHNKRDGTSEVRVSGDKGRRFMEAIHKHLVIKDELAKYILSLPSRVEEAELKAIKKSINLLRQKNVPTKVHPSRRWAAGYIDGDGCLSASLVRNGEGLECRLSVSSWNRAKAGLELLMKTFGGYIVDVGNASNWRLNLNSTKVNELYNHFGKHLRIKKTQMEIVKAFIGENKHSKRLGCTNEQRQEFVKMLATTKSKGGQEADVIV